MKKVGFTGTQYGCTLAQKEALKKVLRSLPMAEFHHGDCVGADAQAHFCIPVQVPVHIHPGKVDPRKRAHCKGAQKVYPAKPPLDRNLDIVQATELLVACPHTMEEELRSGTWSTVRKARRLNRPVIIVQPDGNVVKEGL